MELPLAYYGDPVLRKKGTKINEITPEIRTLVDDMVDTMRLNNGIGLAAPQVHKSLNLFITEVPIQISKDPEEWAAGQVRVFINPKIVAHSDEEWLRGEGCLSIPGLYAEISRPVTVTVQATDLDGNQFEETFSWLEARAVLHENDHINGVLFIDRIHGKERKEMDRALSMIKQKYKDGKPKGDVCPAG